MLYIFLIILFLYFIIPSNKIKFRIINFKNYVIPMSIILVLILLIIFSEDAFSSAQNGLFLWFNNVVPSLLPFLMCLEILKSTNIFDFIGKLLEPIIRPVFNIPGSGVFAVIMGMCSGYPVGAKFAASLRETNQCSLVEGERLLAFTNTSGPLFIISAVGIGMFKNSKIGLLLLITHFIAALLVGIVFRFYKKYASTNSFTRNEISKINQENASKSKKNNRSNTLNLSHLGSIMGESIRNSISTLLLICGFITFFCVFSTMLDKSGITDLITRFICNIFSYFGYQENIITSLSAGCFKGIFEITNGLKILSTSYVGYNILLPVVATILGFGGISVHMQVASIISSTDLSLKPYILGKSLHGIFAGIITYLVITYTNFFNLETVETFSSIVSNSIIDYNDSPFMISGDLLIIGITCIILILLIRLLYKKVHI